MKRSMFILIASCVACACQAQEQAYISADFSIQYPAGWEAIEQQGFTAFLSPKENEQDDYLENVTVMADDSDGKPFPLKEYVEFAVGVFEKNTFGYDIKEQGNVTVDGKEAFYIVATGAMSGKAKTKQYIVDAGMKKYILTYTALKENYDAYLATADTIMRSLKIRPEE